MQFFLELRWFSFSTEAIKIQDGLPAKSCDFEVVGMKPFNCTTRGFWVMLLLRPRLQGSGQIFERTKTCTDPPFVTWGPNNYSNIQLFVRIRINPKRDENGCFQIRWCHTSFTTSITYALWEMLPYYHSLAFSYRRANTIRMATCGRTYSAVARPNG